MIVPAPKKVGTRAKVIEPAPTVRSAPTADVSDLVARIERIERFGAELRRRDWDRVRELIAFTIFVARHDELVRARGSSIFQR